jgi:7,8-dihydropterin-6-yl-methyl-4-(beta-D-ribofuranosyl)aminobenzene 5'-phosphate synthase
MKNGSVVQISVVYDNNPYDERLKPDWGFSCFVNGLEKSILFDTGAKGRVLLSNLEKIGIKPERIDAVVLSHEHRDHTGGLDALISRNPEIEVWIPHFFVSSFKEGIQKRGAKVFEVKASQNICVRAFSTGVIHGWIKEQSLVLDTNPGLVLITGCAHPRITEIISQVKELFNKNIYLALGGFHLAGFDKADINEIIGKFRDLGVQKVGPCHCSGNDARMFFSKEYQNNFIEIGVGKEIKIQ